MCTGSRMPRTPNDLVMETHLANRHRAARISENEHSTVKMMLMDTNMGITSWNSINICIHPLD
jgi:hypothetical protein